MYVHRVWFQWYTVKVCNEQSPQVQDSQCNKAGVHVGVLRCQYTQAGPHGHTMGVLWAPLCAGHSGSQLSVHIRMLCFWGSLLSVVCVIMYVYVRVCVCVCVCAVFQEYLSLLRWNDGNYWALKDAIKRNHAAIAKLVKKFKVPCAWLMYWINILCMYVCMYRIPLIISFLSLLITPFVSSRPSLLSLSLSPLLSSSLSLLTCPFLPAPGCSIPACSPSVEHWQHCSWQQTLFTEGQVAGWGA